MREAISVSGQVSKQEHFLSSIWASYDCFRGIRVQKLAALTKNGVGSSLLSCMLDNAAGRKGQEFSHPESLSGLRYLHVHVQEPYFRGPLLPQLAALPARALQGGA